MAQLNWTYYSLTGKPYLIEMYHGDESGHLMIFINGDIMQIDFNQVETKTYNFMIENQLVELQITKTPEGYDYEVTPQAPPKIAQEEEGFFDKQFWIPLLFLLLILNLAFYLYRSLSNLG